MRALRVALVVASLALPSSASAGELSLAIKDGRVSLKATDVPLRQVLNEWARVGGTRIVGLEKLSGGLVSLELTDVAEKHALEILLRTVAGYIAAPRTAASAAGASRFDRLVLLPTSHAAAAPMAGPRQPPFAPTPPAPFPDPTQLANQEPESDDGPAPPGVPVFSPNVEPPMPAGQGGQGPGQLRPPVTDEANAPTSSDGPAPGRTPPLTTTRPGVIPVPPPPPRP